MRTFILKTDPTEYPVTKAISLPILQNYDESHDFFGVDMLSLFLLSTLVIIIVHLYLVPNYNYNYNP